jgi:hypothetical protein
LITLNDYLRPLFGRAENVLNSVLTDSEVEIAVKKSVSTIASLESIYRTIANRYEAVVFDQAIHEAKYAVFSVSIGSYRNAYSSLRLFFELNLAAVDFSTNERLFLGWSLGKADILWSRLADAGEGVLSTNFCNLFPLDLAEHAKSYRTMAVNVYRECSEFVHGNPSANSKVPDFLEYKKETVLDWCSKLDTMYLVCIFLFSVRYLPGLSPAQLEVVKTDVLDQISHLAPVRDHLGGVING